MLKKILFIMLVLSLVLMLTACSNYYSIETEVHDGGSIEISPVQDEYEEGEIVKITARPGSIYKFTGWSGDLEGSKNPEEVVEVSDDLIIKAEFAPDPKHFGFDSKTKTITDYYGPEAISLALPAKIDGVKVEKIQGSIWDEERQEWDTTAAFSYRSLQSVVIPDSITKIDDDAFANNNLSSVEIPDSVRYLAGFTSNNLTEIEIPDSVTKIGNYAFSYNQLSTVEIPDSVTEIGFRAFAFNDLTSIEIADSVTKIDERAFENVELSSVEIPDSVEYLAGFPDNKLDKIEIPNSVTKIGPLAFMNNNLSTVKIPDGVTEIGMMAFAGNNLSSVRIPDSVTKIGSGAFDDDVELIAWED